MFYNIKIVFLYILAPVCEHTKYILMIFYLRMKKNRLSELGNPNSLHFYGKMERLYQFA